MISIEPPKGKEYCFKKYFKLLKDFLPILYVRNMTKNIPGNHSDGQSNDTDS